jgi:hypothetical protein
MVWVSESMNTLSVPVTGSDGLALYKWPGFQGDAHLRGNPKRGDPVVTEKPTLEHIDDAVRSKLEPK